MATYNYRPEGISLNIQNRNINQFGKNENGVETETNEDKNIVTRLLNGDVVITGRIQEGATQTVYLARGSADAQFIQDLYDNTTIVSSILTVMSETGSEKIICTEGAVTKINSINHFGSEVNDVAFVIQYGKFNIKHNDE